MLLRGETDRARNKECKNNNITMFIFSPKINYIYVKKDGFRLLTSLRRFDIIE